MVKQSTRKKIILAIKLKLSMMGILSTQSNLKVFYQTIFLTLSFDKDCSLTATFFNNLNRFSETFSRNLIAKFENADASQCESLIDDWKKSDSCFLAAIK